MIVIIPCILDAVCLDFESRRYKKSKRLSRVAVDISVENKEKYKLAMATLISLKNESVWAHAVFIPALTATTLTTRMTLRNFPSFSKELKQLAEKKERGVVKGYRRPRRICSYGGSKCCPFSSAA
eukprot:snap_masked-scaffold_1-processed-gene-20.35-mRNA-1 protein AED:1.00 eAED:1.00 QI:0/-1/0/0/-1/1/1/0/124